MVLRLEVFESGAGQTKTDTVVLDSGTLEEAKLDAFELGYAAGWEDAVNAQTEDQTRMNADLARNMQTLSFTYTEARSHVLRSLQPLLEDLVGRILPAIARESLGPMVRETLVPLAAKLADSPVTLVINPANRAAVEHALSGLSALPLTLEEEASLGDGQAYLRFCTQETHIDLDRAVAEITTAVRGFFDLTLKDNGHG